jgi:hypothetical protein
MKTMFLILVLATPALADGSPPAQSTRDVRQQDPYGAARPIGHDKPISFDSSRQQIPQAPKPGAEKPLGTG